jgi:hypothetical protein
MAMIISKWLSTRHIIAFVVLALPLMFQWGRYHYTSSLHPNESNVPFMGLDAMRQQSGYGFFFCFGVVLLVFAWTIVAGARGKPDRISPDGYWNIALLTVAICICLTWLRVLQLALSGERDRFFVSSIWYQKDLLPAFWVVPVTLLLALVIGLFKPLGIDDRNASMTRGGTNVTESQSALINENPVLIAIFCTLVMVFLGCSIFFWAFKGI